MTNQRNPRQKATNPDRDGNQYFALPHAVLDSAAYQELSPSAKALLIELGRQLGRDNNGMLIATLKKLKPRGWRSNDVITRALKELKGAGLVYQTVKGYRPNRASWYAVTWYALAESKKYDTGATAGFVRGAYRLKERLAQKPDKHSGPFVHPLMRPAADHPKNVSVTPNSSAANDLIAPDSTMAA